MILSNKMQRDWKGANLLEVSFDFIFSMIFFYTVFFYSYYVWSCIIVKCRLLLCLYLGNSLHIILMSKISSTSSQGLHACLNTNCLQHGTIEIISRSSKFHKINLLVFHLPGVDFENLNSCIFVGMGKLDLTIETTWPHQGWIEDIWPVSRTDNLDVIVRREPAIKIINTRPDGSGAQSSFSELLYRQICHYRIFLYR